MDSRAWPRAHESTTDQHDAAGAFLQGVVANIAGIVKWAEEIVRAAVRDLPYASIVMAGVSLVLPLLANPTRAEAANQEGFTYVTSQISYYGAMEGLLLPSDMKADLKANLNDSLVSLYKLIIDFQVQSVMRFYRSRTKNFLRGAVDYDGWEEQLQHIKDMNRDLVAKLETAMHGTSLQELRGLVRESQVSQKTLDNLLGKTEELVSNSRSQRNATQELEKILSDAENRACLEALQASNPRDDKTRIELEKGGLCEEVYRWVLAHDVFRRWRNDQDGLFWIRGDPGKGKTMLLCGIIDSLRITGRSAILSYFFCQATDDRINTAAAVLRGLIYMFVVQRPTLISRLRESYDLGGKEHFRGRNAWVTLSKIFTSILDDLEGDPSQRTYIIIDALDECTGDPDRLLGLIAKKSSECQNVKWLLSSRNWPSIKKDLNTAARKLNLRFELNERSVSKAVTTYIRSKVDKLMSRHDYDKDTRDAVERYLSDNAHGTFLWVSLVCQELDTTPRWRVQEGLGEIPPELNALYRRMMNQIYKQAKDAALCKDILAIVSVVSRPITLDELPTFVDKLDGRSRDYKTLTEIVLGLCRSFLALRDRTISFVHQSTKDFLIGDAYNEIFPSGI
ncbi:hypothetical protein VTG60DRAFT_3933 [Thermothelomyces hinnuleus]